MILDSSALVAIVLEEPDFEKLLTSLSLDPGPVISAADKGSGHPAQLDFGDCIAYGASRSTGQPLLFKGGDFPRTDVAAAV